MVYDQIIESFLDFMTSIVLVHATRIQTYAHGPQSGERLRPMLVLWLTTAMVRWSCRANGTDVSWLPVQCVRQMNFCLLEGVYELLRSHQDRLCIPLTDHGHDTDACQLALPRSTFGCCAAIHPATTLFSSRPGSRHSRTV